MCSSRWYKKPSNETCTVTLINSEYSRITMGKIKLDLTKPMLEYDIVRNVKSIDMVEQIYDDKGHTKSDAQLRLEAPDFTYGKGLVRHLLFFIAPKDIKEVYALNELARRIGNVMNEPGFIELAPSEIHDIIAYLERMQLQPGVQHLTGDLLVWLKQSMNA